MAPISARTALSMSSAVRWGRAETARSTARRGAVTCTPCSRRGPSWSVGVPAGTSSPLAADCGSGPDLARSHSAQRGGARQPEELGARVQAAGPTGPGGGNGPVLDEDAGPYEVL